MERDDPEGVAAFHVPDAPLLAGTPVTLGEDVLHHLRVRRVGVGARVALLDGMGHRAEGTLVRQSKVSATVEVDRVEDLPALPPVHLLVPIADRDRMLLLAEKVAELGASSWRPVLYRRSRSVKPRGEGPMFGAKVRARMASALEQSRGGWLPVVYPEATLERALLAVPEGARLMLDAAGVPVRALPLAAPLTLAVGPEGGFEPEERAAFEAAGFTGAALGGHILRFETAVIAGLAIARSAIAPLETPDVR